MMKQMMFGGQDPAQSRSPVSQASLNEVIRENGDLVYLTALRCLNGNENEARDLAQSVFLDFHHKRQRLAAGTVISGWLYRHTRFMASRFVRAEDRRRRREQEAMRRQLIEAEPSELWESIRPVLDEAMDRLKEADRNVVVLRFLRGLSLRETGVALGISEDAARMRIGRALDRLREVLKAFGIQSASGTLSASLLLASLGSAPAGFAKATTAAVALAGAAPSAGFLIETLTMTKLKTSLVGLALVVGVGVPYYATQKFARQRAVHERAVAALHDRIAELEASNKNLAESESALQEQTAKLSRERAELFKLRGRVQSLKRENEQLRGEPETAGAQESPDGTPDEGPIKTFFGELNTDLRSGEAVVIGGWPVEEGQLGFMVLRAEAVEGTPDGQVVVKSGILKGSEDVAHSLNLDAVTTQDGSSSSGVLDSEVLDAYLDLEREEGSIEYMGSPMVTTLSGQQATISMAEEREFEGAMHKVGTTLNVIPEILEDGSTVRVTLLSEWALPSSSVADDL